MSLTACHVDPLRWSDIVADQDAWHVFDLYAISELEDDNCNTHKYERRIGLFVPSMTQHLRLLSPVDDDLVLSFP